MKSTITQSIPINVLHDNIEVIGTKRQLAKRLAFAALNIELQDGITYTIHGSGDWQPNANPFNIDVDENPITAVNGQGVYTYRITYEALEQPE